MSEASHHEPTRPGTGQARVDEAARAIWAPWRLPYLEAIGQERPGEQQDTAPPGGSTGCFLGDDWLTPEHDAKNFVIHRDDQGMILLNAYPYSNGHLLVAMGEGRARLLDYEPAQRAHLWSLVDLAADLMERTLEPQGINIGVNQGRAAGAGVPQHLHVHLVPRWGGDVNFISVVGGVRVIPSALEAMYERYLAGAKMLGLRS